MEPAFSTPQDAIAGVGPLAAGDVDEVGPDQVDAFLELRPVWYPPAGGSAGHWGFPAEAVAEIDPRLVHFTYAEEAYDEAEVDLGDGRIRTARILKPDARRTVAGGVAYDRMTVLLHAVAKRQQAELETLEDELCLLAARVEGLEDSR